MDRSGIDMDKIGPNEATALLSRQVTGGRYFFLNLAPGKSPGLAWVMGGREHCNPDYALARRHFPFHGLECVVAGRGRVKLDGREHELGAGSVFAYAPDTDCELRADPSDPMVKYFVALAGRAVALPARGGRAACAGVRPVSATPEGRALLQFRRPVLPAAAPRSPAALAAAQQQRWMSAA
jgi:hypothetical protein